MTQISLNQKPIAQSFQDFLKVLKESEAEQKTKLNELCTKVVQRLNAAESEGLIASDDRCWIIRTIEEIRYLERNHFLLNSEDQLNSEDESGKFEKTQALDRIAGLFSELLSKYKSFLGVDYCEEIEVFVPRFQAISKFLLGILYLDWKEKDSLPNIDSCIQGVELFEEILEEYWKVLPKKLKGSLEGFTRVIEEVMFGHDFNIFKESSALSEDFKNKHKNFGRLVKSVLWTIEEKKKTIPPHIVTTILAVVDRLEVRQIFETLLKENEKVPSHLLVYSALIFSESDIPVEQIAYKIGPNRVHIQVVTNNATKEDRYKIYDKEWKFSQEFPDAPFSFEVIEISEFFDIDMNKSYNSIITPSYAN